MRAFLAFLFVLTVCLGATAPVLAAPKPDTLILISIDGLRADYLARGKTPVIQALADAGVRAAMRPAYPSETFPNHYTLVTGLWPDHHGVVANTMDDRVLGHFTMAHSDDPRWWSQGQPIWVTADEQGLRTATMFWPGSDKVIRGHRPDLWKTHDKAFLADDRVGQVLTWLDLPPGQRPSVVTLYFDLVDTEGHRHGPNSKVLDAALASTDSTIGKLVDGLKARGLYGKVNLIVTGDHGMADTSKDRLIYIDDIAGGADRIHTVTLGARGHPRPAAGASRPCAMLGQGQGPQGLPLRRQPPHAADRLHRRGRLVPHHPSADRLDQGHQPGQPRLRSGQPLYGDRLRRRRAGVQGGQRAADLRQRRRRAADGRTAAPEGPQERRIGAGVCADARETLSEHRIRA
ncbi:MAG TPA: ectonucleotide pyrophosphatase/phosphodiesterase [Caulobacteraceae bacterium]